MIGTPVAQHVYGLRATVGRVDSLVYVVVAALSQYVTDDVVVPGMSFKDYGECVTGSAGL